MSTYLKLFYASSNASANIRENFWTTILSALTIGFSLAIVTLFFIIFVNLNGVISKWGERTHIVAYLTSSAVGTQDDGVDKYKASIEALPGVTAVKYVSQEAALATLKQELKGHEAIFAGVEPTLLPASFEVMVAEQFRDPDAIVEIVKKIEAFKWIKEVEYGRQWLGELSSLLGFFEIVALFVGIFLGAAALFIISNTIRLTVYARKEEIEVMRLIGASDAYIRVPFLIEGFILGLIGALLAVFMLFLGQYLFIMKIPDYFGFVLINPFNSYFLFSMLLLSGTLLGVVGSLFSLGKFLNVQQ